VRKVAVAAERQFAQHEVAHRVEAVFADQLVRRDEVAERFRHFLAFDGPPAVRENTARRFNPGSHQKGVPINRMKSKDILTYHMKTSRPKY